MIQEGWTIDTRGRLVTPEQNEIARRDIEEARLKRAANTADGRDLRREFEMHSQERHNVNLRNKVNLRNNANRMGDVDGLAGADGQGVGVARPPSTLPETGMPRIYIPYMERGSFYRHQYQDKGKGKAKVEEEDNDPHYIEEDAVFEFWLANIWNSVNPGWEVVEQRKQVVVNKKKQFFDIWRNLCCGKD